MTPLTAHRRAPNDLRSAGKNVWRTLSRTHNYGAAELQLLYLLAQAVDTQAELRATLNREGLIYQTPSGQIKQRPEVQLETAAVRTISKLYAQLDGAETVERPDLMSQLQARRAAHA